jgi:hypothetical protein
MKKVYLLIIGIVLVTIVKAQQAQIMLCNASGSSCTAFTNVNDAYTAAVNGDVIYLPGGVFALPDIVKEISVIGVGANVDSTFAYGGKTTINGNINIQSNNITLEGLFVVGNINNNSGGDVSNIKVKYCKFQNFVGVPISNSSCKINNSFIIGCFCSAVIEFGYAVNNDYLNTGSGNFILNSITSGIYHCTGGTINNCLFNPNCITIRLFNNNISNCIFMGYSGFNFYSDLSDFNVFTNCYGNGLGVYSYTGWGANNVFTNHVNFSTNNNNYPFNPLLPVGSISFPVKDQADIPDGHPSKIGATDNGEVGINGGLYPWRVISNGFVSGGHGCVPSNPHIYAKVIATATNSNGTLPVQIKVRAGN